MASLLVGFVLGMGRLAAELNKANLDGWLLAYAEINFLHFAALLFIVCSLVLVAASMTAPAPSREQLEGLTFQTTAQAHPAENVGSRTEGVALSGLLVAAVVAIWLYFS
jgi:SSS family solute:Na+ symporter